MHKLLMAIIFFFPFSVKLSEKEGSLRSQLSRKLEGARKWAIFVVKLSPQTVSVILIRCMM